MSRPTLVILAGGKGTRLGPLTKDIPKPMIEVHGKPFLYWLIKHYFAQGFTNIIVSTDYKAEVIKEYSWPWALKFMKDFEMGFAYCNPSYFYMVESGLMWVVNGDTFIPEHLPKVCSPTILSCGDKDAGAQFSCSGKIKIHPVKEFYDIGTPEGLERFKDYFASNLTHLAKD